MNNFTQTQARELQKLRRELASVEVDLAAAQRELNTRQSARQDYSHSYKLNSMLMGPTPGLFGNMKDNVHKNQLSDYNSSISSVSRRVESLMQTRQMLETQIQQLSSPSAGFKR